MEKIITNTRPMLGKFLLIAILMMPVLIMLEVLPTLNAIIFFALILSTGAIWCWGLKGGTACAVYCFSMMGLLSFISWALSVTLSLTFIVLYLLAGMGAEKIKAIWRGYLAGKTPHFPGKGKQVHHIITEIRQAKEELDLARQNFENADEEIIDTAIYQLNDATAKYDRLTVILKKNWERYALTVKINIFPRS